MIETAPKRFYHQRVAVMNDVILRLPFQKYWNRPLQTKTQEIKQIDE
ncbi:hypothetical protein [Cytobacillus firmus]|nr:hypothetical protein [Cytobacillus firmus]